MAVRFSTGPGTCFKADMQSKKFSQDRQKNTHTICDHMRPVCEVLLLEEMCPFATISALAQLLLLLLLFVLVVNFA